MPHPLRLALLIAAALTPILHAKPKPPPDWRLLLRARPRDHDRLRDWRLTWTAALAQVRAAGQGAKLDREGALLQPDIALAPPDAPSGDYRCRPIRLGAVAANGSGVYTNPFHHEDLGVTAISPGAPVYVELPAAPCRIAPDAALTVLRGVQRPAGRMWPWDGLRLLFLGAVAVGDEGSALPYGRDPDRNVVGFFDRIGPARWRLVIPKPAWGAQIEIVEVVPAGG